MLSGFFGAEVAAEVGSILDGAFGRDPKGPLAKAPKPEGEMSPADINDMVGQTNPTKFQIFRHSGIMEIEIDLPGRVRGDVAITAKDQPSVLFVEAAAKDTRRHRRHVRLSFNLKPNADIDHITARMANGVLVIRIPQMSETKPEPRRIKVV
jgi:HSP20 family molecular chaperone IbpA